MSAGAGLVFKGSGFYITDYGKDGKKDQPVAAKKDAGGDGGSTGSESSAAAASSEPKSSSSETKASPSAPSTDSTSAASAPSPAVAKPVTKPAAKASKE